MAKITSFGFRIFALLLSLLYMAALPLSFLWAPVPTEPPLHGSVTVTAHTGYMGLAENSVAAMEAGVAAGAEIIEFDLHFRADGTPVLSHYDPGENDCATLADAFAFLAAHPDRKANVDVKSTAFLEKVQPMAQEAGVLEQLFFTGLDETAIPAAAQACPDIPYYLNVKVTADEDYAALAEKAAALGAVGVNLDHRDASIPLVSAMHAKGLLVSVWTIENPQDAVRAIRMGADNITTLRPVLLRLLLLHVGAPKTASKPFFPKRAVTQAQFGKALGSR